MPPEIARVAGHHRCRFASAGSWSAALTKATSRSSWPRCRRWANAARRSCPGGSQRQSARPGACSQLSGPARAIGGGQSHAADALHGNPCSCRSHCGNIATVSYLRRESQSIGRLRAACKGRRGSPNRKGYRFRSSPGEFRQRCLCKAQEILGLRRHFARQRPAHARIRLSAGQPACRRRPG